jgi:hypothetical protein
VVGFSRYGSFKIAHRRGPLLTNWGGEDVHDFRDVTA